MHGGDNRESMEADFETGWVKCFTAGCLGRISDHPDTYGTRNDDVPRPVSRPVPPPPPPLLSKAAGLMKALERASARLSRSPGANYLEGRNISPTLALTVGMGWGQTGALANRIVFPLTDPAGVPTSATGRAIVDAVTPKYRNLAVKDGYPKGWFNGGAISRVRESGSVLYVCEGPFDALALIAGGVEDAIAILGVDDFRPSWLVGVREMVICFDADEAGREKRADFAFAAAGVGARVSLLSPDALDGCKDLGEYWQTHGALPPALLHVPDDPNLDDSAGWCADEIESITDMAVGPNAPARHATPEGCIASAIACPILGVCDRHLAGDPCLVAEARQEAA